MKEEAEGQESGSGPRMRITEYAETFPFVGGDFTFYNFYAASFWSKLFEKVPPRPFPES
jgi:uncharacterized protein YecE (DUF72 family)